MFGTLSPLSGQASLTNGDAASVCRMTKAPRALGARGGGSAQVIPSQEKEAAAMVGMAQTGQTSMDREAWEEATASVNTGDMALITSVGEGGGNHPYGGPHPYQGGGGQCDWRAGWTDTRNHKLKVMMDPYLEW
jgi:hypothetical protein